MTATAPTGMTSRARRRYPALDGLRAVAVLAVVATHVAFQTGRYERGWGASALARLDSGVAIFFVLSGFLLLRPWLSALAARADGPSVRVYFVRRVARIYPAYLLSIPLAFLVMPENQGTPWQDWVRHTLQIQIYQPGWLRPGLTQTWSLAVEWCYYLLLPIFAVLLIRACGRVWRPGRILIMLGLLTLASPIWELTFPHLGNWAATGGLWLPSYTAWFAGGMLLAVIRVELDRREGPAVGLWAAAEDLGRHPFTCWAIAFLAWFAALTPIAGPRSLEVGAPAEMIVKHLLYLLAATALVWPAVLGGTSIVDSLLGNRVMNYLGQISYGVFLYHLVFLDLTMQALDMELFTGDVFSVLALTLVGTGVLAALSERWLERPILAAAHRQRPTPAKVDERHDMPGGPRH